MAPARASDPPGSASVRVLGPVEIEVGGAAVELPGPRQRALLAALAVSRRPVSVGELVDAVWDDDPPAGARTTLQTYVSRLRRVLGSEAITHGPGGYALDRAVEVDLDAVRTRVRSIEQLAPDDEARRGALAREALDAWRGPPFAEFEGSEWFEGVRAELRNLHADLVDLAAAGSIADGRPAQAVALLESSLLVEPWREPSHALLVRALHAAGRSTDALRAASRYRRRLRDETGLFPGSAFAAAESAVLTVEPSDAEQPHHGVDAGPARSPVADDGPPTAETVPLRVGDLPRPTPLIGRRDDLDRLRRAATTSRLVTVVGPGGIGKTRLVAELLEHTHDDRSRIVIELAAVGSDAVATELASALGLRAERADAAIVAERMRGAGMLLVLDNAEHLLAEVRELCRVITARCPEAQVIVTSRARLELPGEEVVQVGALHTDGATSEAALLFLDRLRRAGPGHDLEIDQLAVESLCRRVDGIPLALELAASRAAVLGIAELDRLLAESTELLTRVDSTRGRHASLGNVVAWSAGLLGDQPRRLLAALSVLGGEFDLDAAIAVGSPLVDDPVPVLFGRLLDLSLVSVGSRPGTYRLLDMVRSFAAEELDARADADCVRRAHAAWILDRVERLATTVPGPRERDLVDDIDALRHEVRTAARWSLQHDDAATAAKIAAALAGPLLYRPDIDLLREIRRIGASDDLVGTPCERTALAASARAAFLLGELDDVEGLAQRAIDLAAGGVEPAAQHRAEHALGVLSLYQGRFEESRDWFDRVLSAGDASSTDLLDALTGSALACCYLGHLADARAAIDRLQGSLAALPSETYGAFGDYIRAEVHLAAGDVDAAAALLVEAAECAWSARAAFVWGVSSTVLAAVLVRHRSVDEARRHLPILLQRWRRTATWPQLWTSLRVVAEHLAVTGEPAVARLILEAADRDPAAPSLTGADLDRIDELRRRLDDELGFVAAGTAVAATTVDRVVVLDRALEALRTPVRAPVD